MVISKDGESIKQVLEHGKVYILIILLGKIGTPFDTSTILVNLRIRLIF